VLTVRRDSEAYKGTVFFEGLVGRVRYWLWKDGIIPDDIGAYADNGHRPDRQRIRNLMLRGGCFCMAVPTTYMRLAGLEVPYRPDMKGNKAWDGSISAAFDGPVYGNGYFHDEAVPFDMQRAKDWAEETRSAVLLGKGYRGRLLTCRGTPPCCCRPDTSCSRSSGTACTGTTASRWSGRTGRTAERWSTRDGGSSWTARSAASASRPGPRRERRKSK
jgi:hypothetical protein